MLQEVESTLIGPASFEITTTAGRRITIAPELIGHERNYPYSLEVYNALAVETGMVSAEKIYAAFFSDDNQINALGTLSSAMLRGAVANKIPVVFPDIQCPLPYQGYDPSRPIGIFAAEEQEAIEENRLMSEAGESHWKVGRDLTCGVDVVAAAIALGGIMDLKRSGITRRQFLTIFAIGAGYLSTTALPDFFKKVGEVSVSRVQANRETYLHLLQIGISPQDAQKYAELYLDEIDKFYPFTVGLRNATWMLKLKCCDPWSQCMPDQDLTVAFPIGTQHIGFSEMGDLSTNQLMRAVRRCVTAVGKGIEESGRQTIRGFYSDYQDPYGPSVHTLTDMIAVMPNGENWMIGRYPVQELVDYWS